MRAYWGWALLLAVVLEFLLLTFWRNCAGPYLSPVLFYLASWLVALFATRSYQQTGWYGAASTRTTRRFLLVVPLLALGAFIPRLARVFARSPLVVSASDVIPSINIYVERLLHGQPVYSYFTELGYTLYPTYLPALWLPFVVPEVLGFDYRWLAAGVLAVALLVFYCWPVVKQPSRWAELLLKLVLPFVMLQGVLKMDVGLFGYSVESLIIGYYLCLAASLYRRSSWQRAAPLVLCLLSRFSLVLWVPLWLALIWQQEGRTSALRLSAGVALGVLLLYVLPFLSHDWQALALGQQTYLRAAQSDWQQLLPGTQQPWPLYQGLGFAAYFYQYAPGTLLHRIELIRLVQAGSCLLVVLAAAVYWFRYRPALDYRLFALVVLKVYLATFYAFVQVPYSYLVTLVIFMSLPLLALAKLMPAALATADVAPPPAAPKRRRIRLTPRPVRLLR
ncbi:hypothetical protein LJ737_08290 [Hymenobacter sp. 15J16-1T3B]|uniref:hypothetical protein n=1 Tax=Hymenobacter sp. 15J16-1T3B TaxID=2886941 RepID=UPI001D122E83|nr:hypothetical protein [Hymenobacter sp. 15J16-1T3B]MCC3157234.1 hypothetical protein [Hymenobacter sp. 15J16-1T3B]